MQPIRKIAQRLKRTAFDRRTASSIDLHRQNNAIVIDFAITLSRNASYE
jgi:hypothetical protein